MGHTDRKARRAADKAARQGKNPDREARRVARREARARGRDSGSFSEVGPGEPAPSIVQRAKNAARRAFLGPKMEARRQSLRIAAGGKKKTPMELGRENALGSLMIAGTGGRGAFGGRSTLAGSIFRAARAKAPAIVPKAAFTVAGAGTLALFAGTAEKKGGQMAHRGAGKAMGQLPGVGGTLPSKDTVVKVWSTGTAEFARLLDGRIAVQKKDGTIKTYRPQKHIVIPRNPRVGTLIRADKRLDTLTKGLRKVVRTGKR